MNIYEEMIYHYIGFIDGLKAVFKNSITREDLITSLIYSKSFLSIDDLNEEKRILINLYDNHYLDKTYNLEQLISLLVKDIDKYFNIKIDEGLFNNEIKNIIDINDSSILQFEKCVLVIFKCDFSKNISLNIKSFICSTFFNTLLRNIIPYMFLSNDLENFISNEFSYISANFDKFLYEQISSLSKFIIEARNLFLATNQTIEKIINKPQSDLILKYLFKSPRIDAISLGKEINVSVGQANRYLNKLLDSAIITLIGLKKNRSFYFPNLINLIIKGGVNHGK